MRSPLQFVPEWRRFRGTERDRVTRAEIGTTVVEVGVTPIGLGAIPPELGALPTEIATTATEIAATTIEVATTTTEIGTTTTGVGTILTEVGVLQTGLGGVAIPVSEVATRLVRLNEEGVTFTWKNYADPDRIRDMTLSGEEFLRRFLLHVLHDRFVRIRYFGLLANRHRQEALARCRELLPGCTARPAVKKADWRELYQKLTGLDLNQCEVCGQKALRLTRELSPVRCRERPPPCA